MATINVEAKDGKYVWKDVKHWMWFPFSFTKYTLEDDRLMIQRGLFKTTYDETLIYRIIDIKLTRTMAQKLFGTGTICLRVRVDADNDIDLVNIKRPMAVKKLLSHMVEDSRNNRNLVGKEFYGMDRPGMPPMMGDMGEMDYPDDEMEPPTHM